MPARGPLSKLPKPVKHRLTKLVRELRYQLGPRLGSELRKRWIILCHPGCEIRFAPSARLGPGFRLHMPGAGAFIVGPDVEFRRNFLAEITRGGRVTIDEGAVLGYDVILGCSTAIEIGKRVIIGPGCYVSDGSHDYGGDIKKTFLERGYKFEPLRLEDDAAVATKCTVTASMGERAMAAANTVVRKPVPAYYAVAGVPGRLARYFGPPDAEPEEGRRERLAWEAERLSRVLERTDSSSGASTADPTL